MSRYDLLNNIENLDVDSVEELDELYFSTSVSGNAYKRADEE